MTYLNLAKRTTMMMTAIIVTFMYGAFSPAQAASSHALTLYGEPKYASHFTHFDYVNPNAPKGGTIKLASPGTYDSLNPYILKGVSAPGLVGLVYESLMTRSLDESQSFYPTIARSVNIADDKRSATFTLNPNARWHDGNPITPADVVFSFTTLKTKGDPQFALLYQQISQVKASGNTVTFTFTDPDNRELPTIAAQMPILPKHYYEAHDFEKPGLDVPLGSGPYRVGKVDPGRSIRYERVDDWWAKVLPVNVGQYNFDVIHYDLYRDEGVSLEAFKAGEYDFRREYISRNWATAYDSKALTQGKFIKREMQHRIPQGMQAFVINARQPKFTDRRVREAIGLTMDFEWVNKNLFFSAYKRNSSFFLNTDFEAKGLPSEAELALLEPHREQLPPALFTQAPAVPKNDGSGNARANLLNAQSLLNQAGFTVKGGKRMDPHTGKQMHIEFLLRQATMGHVIGAMRKNLERLGISANIRLVDDAQYLDRVRSFDYDMISFWFNNGVTYPGNEQKAYWHSSQIAVKGSSHLTGLSSPAVDAVLERLVSAKTLDDLGVAARTLDRILLFEHIAIPHWHSNSFRIAYWDKFGLPKTPPSYDIGLLTWWARK